MIYEIVSPVSTLLQVEPEMLAAVIVIAVEVRLQLPFKHMVPT